MQHLVRDIRHAFRGLRRSPGFSLLALGTLALGLGANTTLFTLVHRVLLRPFDYPRSGELVMISRDGQRDGHLSLPDAVDLRARLHGLTLAAYTPGWSLDLTGEGDPLRLTGSTVEPEFFEVLETAPLMGRVFTAADGDAALAVVQEELWRSRLGGRPDILGHTLHLGGHPYQVVGVMPRSFAQAAPGVQIWVPIRAETPWAVDQRGSNHLAAVGRLRGGATVEQANVELTGASRELAAAYPRTNAGKILTATALRDYVGAPARPALLALWGAVGLLLLITCANLASLLLARGIARQSGMAVRLALGARPGALLRGVLIEGLILALGGALLGLGLSAWGLDSVRVLAGPALPRTGELRLDGAAVGVSLAAALLTTLIFALVPAWRAARTSPAGILGSVRGGVSGGAHRLLSGAIVAESAIAMVLLVACLLLGRTFAALTRVDLGFVPDRVLSAELVLPEARYGDPARQTRAFTEVVRRVSALPGVVAAATVIGPPMKGGVVGHTVVIEGAPTPAPGDEPGARSRPVVGDYFAALRIPILRGRGFAATDDERDAPVAIVNQTFAQRHWPGQDPIGRRLAFRMGSDSLRWLTVVGVAGDVRTRGPAGGDAPAVYTPYVQREATWQRFGTLMVRSQGDPASLIRPVQQALWAVDPAVPLEDVRTMPQVVQDTLGQERLSAAIALALATAALLISAQGIFGVLSFVAGLRRREIALRLALGAAPAVVAREMAGRMLRLALAGLGLGLVAGLLFSRLLQALLFGVTPADWPSYAGAGGLLLAAALGASLWPALRAVRLDPALVLRDE